MNQPMVPGQPGQRNLAQIIANLGQQSALVKQSAVDPRALAAGIKPAFASVTFKGKTWGIRHRGQTAQLLTRDPTTGQIIAIPYIDIIIVKSATAISKTFYIDKYKEGDYRQPDCWSTNGQVPDPAAPKKQSPTCRGCQWDAFGSRTMDDGRKGKACSDNKRIAVVPAADIKNENYGGPMLLKLPPSSFAGLAELESQLHQQGYTYFALVMRCSFDHTVAYPKVIFTPISVLNDYQMQEVLLLQQAETTERILNEEVYEATADPEQPTPEQLAPQQAAQPQPVQPQPVQPQPIQPQPFQPTAFTPAAPPVQQPVQPTMTTAFMAQPEPQPVVTMMPSNSPMIAHTNGTGQPLPNADLTALAGLPQPTAEQQEIARLRAELAAAQQKPARAPRKRTTPVTPTGQPTVQVQPPPPQGQPDQPLPFTAHASHPDGADTGGDMPPDLDSRIDNLLNPGGKS